jgi:hypothetical protein
MAPRYVLRWHKRTSWRRRGTELGAIDLGAELRFVQKACLAQSVKYKALNLVVVGSKPHGRRFLILFVFVTYLFFFAIQIFRLCRWFVRPDLFLIHLFFVFVTDLFIRPDFFYPASTAAVCHSGRKPSTSPLFAQLTTIKIKWEHSYFNRDQIKILYFHWVLLNINSKYIITYSQ